MTLCRKRLNSGGSTVVKKLRAKGWFSEPDAVNIMFEISCDRPWFVRLPVAWLVRHFYEAEYTYNYNVRTFRVPLTRTKVRSKIIRRKDSALLGPAQRYLTVCR